MASKARELANLGNAYSDGALSNRNLIINGNFTVSQRGDFTSATNLTSTATYLVDRWKFYDTGVSGTATHSTRMMRLDATSTGTGQVRGEQFVETQNILPSQTYVLSAYVKSNKSGAGIAVFDDETSGAGDTDVYTASHSGAGNWERLSVSFTTRAAEPYQFFIRFALTPTGNGSITSGDYLEIKEVQLEVGDTATPFEHRSYGQELALCQRYYETDEPESGSDTRISMNKGSTAATYYFALPYKVTKRALPTVTINQTYDDNFTLLYSSGSSSRSHLGITNASGGSTDTRALAEFNWIADAEL